MTVLHMSLNSINGIIFRNRREAGGRKRRQTHRRMNYSNIDCQTQKTQQPAKLVMLVDRRGNRHLVAERKSKSVRRGFARLGALGVATILGATAAHAEFNISTGVGPFAPSFRDLGNLNANFTTHWGWGPGAFDGPTNNENIDLPPVTLGIGGVDGTLSQGTDLRDIVSSGNSIYTFTFTSAGNPMNLQFGVPTNGTPGSGFTTIILQGMTMNFGSDTTFPDDSFIFPDVAGISPAVVIGQNNAAPFKLGQFWAKYEIPGNAANYNIDLSLAANHVSISRLEVDTQWSATGYAPDTAVVPEPSAALLTVAGSAALILRRRRSSGK